ncbi:MAG: hypothetical protein IGR93_01370 [Hydrococcus sp. C42_A2020_068]|uniref:hypothetical protein n=1 Tax=Pleurocapsa sp. PCC 7327 TaxID=118163 RepID=UPI00029FDCD7|nr:hypothetical protein [Pleurocapsa sp. PCC 7327]AFY76417.1 hypothetical protein Ple7327_0999 [Pleurocapsa sp. PCC 7327]MBF2018778.1 hypothetical protein [Hydrococcus sp. C42_A2020_068]
MNKLLIIFSLPTTVTLLTLSTITYSQTENHLKPIHNNLPPEDSSRPEQQSFIVGLWRGYRKEKNFTMYYGYEFRSNGTYFARHRVYQNQETIQDEIWQGQWELNDDLLYLKGTSKTNKRRTVRVRFRLANDNQLYYDGGTLAKPYIPLKLGRQN